MEREDLDTAIEWAAREGWNPGLHDADSFFTADPNGFLLAELNGEPIGCISIVAYDAKFGFLGFYIVLPEYRGRGFGLALWQTGMEYLGERNVGLDGVLNQQENYKRSGFKLAYRNVRYEGVGGGIKPEGLTDLAEVPFPDLLKYDRALFPADRPEFLSRWIAISGSKALAYQEGRLLKGYGVVRPCRTGFKIGPLFANTPQIASSLFAGLSAHAAGAPLFLDTPETNPAAVKLAQSHGMTPVFETARMYTGPAPEIPLERIFGVTSFELG